MASSLFYNQPLENAPGKAPWSSPRIPAPGRTGGGAERKVWRWSSGWCRRSTGITCRWSCG